MANRITKPPTSLDDLSDPVLSKSVLIMRYTYESVHSLSEAFKVVKKNRGASRGATTYEEQDLLRAMLVMSASGLDSTLKQLIRDVVPKLHPQNVIVRKGVERFIKGRFSESQSDGGERSAQFLSRVLASNSVQQAVLEEYIYSLTDSSLQSAEELMKAAASLGLDPKKFGMSPADLKPTFDIRNQIIHELDVNFDEPRRNRRSRRITTMTDHTNKLLRLGYHILDGVGELVRC